MIGQAFGCVQDYELRALQKRATIIVVSEKAIYLRLPGEVS